MFTGVLAYLGMLCLYILSTKYIAAFGFLVPFALIAADLSDEKEPSFLARVLYRLSIIGLFPLILLVGNYLITGQIFGKYYFAGKIFAAYYLGAIALSIAICLAILRFGAPLMNKARSDLTKSTALERNKKVDVRDVDKYFEKIKETKFDPRDFIDLKHGIFLGLDEYKKPVYVDFKGGTAAPHVEVVGTTGAGKGVSLGVMASQFLARGEAVFFCDPKNDEWAPHVMHDAARRAGVPFHFINLNSPHGPQFNIFEGATKEEAFELFIGAFSLTEKGASSDFYGIADRRVASMAADELARGGTAATLYQQRGDEFRDEAEKFAGKLRELATTPSINANSGGVDFAKIVESGGCVYIVGSMRNDIIKTIQRMLLIRFIQLAERRDRIGGPLRPVCIILDELKYHISRPALEGLGAARDKGVHLVLAHQSLGDLKDCPADINPDAVVDAVVENCRIKLAYQVQSPITAEWLSEMSGKVLVDNETRRTSTNLALAETVAAERSIRQDESCLVPTNFLLKAPPQVAVLYGSGLAKLIKILPLQVEKSRAAITPVIVAVPAAATAAGRGVLDLDLDDEGENPEPDYSESESDSLSESESESESETKGALDLDD